MAVTEDVVAVEEGRVPVIHGASPGPSSGALPSPAAAVSPTTLEAEALAVSASVSTVQEQEPSSSARFLCCSVGPMRLAYGMETVAWLVGVLVCGVSAAFSVTPFAYFMAAGVLAVTAVFVLSLWRLGRSASVASALGRDYQFLQYVRSGLVAVIGVSVLMLEASRSLAGEALSHIIAANAVAALAALHLPFAFIYAKALQRLLSPPPTDEEEDKATLTETERRPPSYSVAVLSPPGYGDVLRLYPHMAPRGAARPEPAPVHLPVLRATAHLALEALPKERETEAANPAY